MCLLTAGTHILPWNYGVKYLSPNPKQFFKLICIACSAFWKANFLKVELSMIKIGESLRKLWSLRSCFLILPPGALIPKGVEGAMKRDVSKHLCTLQWCASRGRVIAHENWTSWYQWIIIKDLKIPISKMKLKHVLWDNFTSSPEIIHFI